MSDIDTLAANVAALNSAVAALQAVVTGASSTATTLNSSIPTMQSLVDGATSSVVSGATATVAANALLYSVLPVAVSDEVTSLTTGTAKVTFRMPKATTLSGIRASLTTAQTSGSIFTVDVKKNGSSILSTKLTIDNTEKTSVTAATPPVLSSSTLEDDSEITIDILQLGDGTAKGLKVYLIGGVYA